MMYWEQDSREFYNDEEESSIEVGLQVRELGSLGSFDELDEIPY